MSEISFTNDGFVDMDQFDGTDPEAFTALSELGAGDAVPMLGEEGWGEVLGNTFDPDYDPGISLDDLFEGPAVPFEVDDSADDNPFDIDEMWGSGDSEAGGGGVEDLLDDVDLDGTDLDLPDKDLDVDPVGDGDLDDLDGGDLDGGTGSTVGEMVDFDDGDVGETVGSLVDFDDDGGADDLDFDGDVDDIDFDI